jgi:TPR repeat protein
MAEAQCDLGTMYDKGEGVQQDFKQAAAWYRKAADQGNAKAQCTLGNICHQGQGVQQDSKQAVAWYRKAADQATLQGDAEVHSIACLNLGILSELAGDYRAAFASYRAGQAADRDYARAGMRRCLEHMAEGSKKDQGK